jgi:FlaA1/EpsC-like NDP-sugar epimerase
MVSQAWRIGIKRKPWQIPPRLRFLSLIGIYGFILLFSSQAALQLRFDFAVPEEFNQRWYFSSLWIIPLKLLLLAFFGQFRSLLTFFSFPDAKRLSLALGLAMVIELGVWFLAPGESMIPRGVIVVEFVLSLACLAGLRI